MTVHDLIALDRLPELAPGWPFSPWATGRLIRSGRLGCVRIGKRVYLTRPIIEAFIAAHTVPVAR